MGLIRAVTFRLQDLAAPGYRGLESAPCPLIQIPASGEAGRLLNIHPPHLLRLLPRHAAPRIRRDAPRLKEGASGLLGLVLVAPAFLLVVDAQPRLLGLVGRASLGLSWGLAQRLTLLGDVVCLGHVESSGHFIFGHRLLFGGFCHLVKRASAGICRLAQTLRVLQFARSVAKVNRTPLLGKADWLRRSYLRPAESRGEGRRQW